MKLYKICFLMGIGSLSIAILNSHFAMRDLLGIFDVFSKRPEASKKPTHEVPDTTRNRVFYWCGELFSGKRPSEYILNGGDYIREFWEEIYRRLIYRTGQLALSSKDDGRNPAEAIRYLMNCPGQQFLDFLEDIFNNDAFPHVNMGDKNIVDELNTLLRQDGLPYSVTYFIKEEVKATVGWSAGHSFDSIRAYPKVIMKESEVLHESAIKPALALLADKRFSGANEEFLAALEDYRKGDIGDCLTKCGSAFESVLKVVCDQRKWSYKQTDTASTLVKTVIEKTNLDNYFEQLLIIVATLRNKMSTAHGAGASKRQPAPHLAQYALNVTASAILMLVEEAKL